MKSEKLVFDPAGRFLPQRIFRAFDRGLYKDRTPALVWLEEYIDGEWIYDGTYTAQNARLRVQELNAQLEWWPRCERPHTRRVEDE